MDPVAETTKWLFTQGVLGILVFVLGFLLYRKDQALTACQSRLVEVTGNVSGLIERVGTALETNSAIIERRSQTSEELTRVVLESGRQIERDVDRIEGCIVELTRAAQGARK